MSGALLLAAVDSGPLIEAPNVSRSKGPSASPVTSSLNWESDGDISTDASAFDQWMTPKIGALVSMYEIKFEQSAGDTLDGTSDSLSTWLALSTTRSLDLTVSGGTKSANGTYIIRHTSGTELDNGTWQLDVIGL